MRSRMVSLIVVIAVAAGFAPAARAADVAGVFRQGSTQVVASGGTGYAFNETYFVLGLGANYYVVDGLNVGLAVEWWSGSSPGVYKLTPSVQYVFHQMQTLKPYVGVFYRRTYVDGLADINSVGGRAGAYLQAGRNTYIGGGVVYERYVSCNESVYRSCSDTYPELSITLAF
jgi:hypothetical protein